MRLAFISSNSCDILKEKCRNGELDMKKVGLVLYGLSFEIDEKKMELHSIFNNRGLIDIIEEFAVANKDNFSNDPERESIFLFEKVERAVSLTPDGKEECDFLFGRVKTGEYGIESELMDITDGSVYKRRENQADMLPFGFCIALPKGVVNQAIIVLQTLGNYGMKIALQRKLLEGVTAYNLEGSLLWGQILPKAYIDKFFNHGILQKIRMIRYEIPEDVSNRIGINHGVKQTREERVICKPIGFLERKRREINEWIAGQRSYTNIIEIEDFEYDDLKLEFKLGKTNKVISMKDTTNLRVTEDVTDQVDVFGGNPEFESLKRIMQDTARDYLSGMGLL